MKSKLLFLCAVLQSGFLFSQFDPSYFGQYKTEDDRFFYYFSEYEGDLDTYLTSEQRKNVTFFFSCQSETETFGGVAMKKGDNYVSHVIKEITPAQTFTFKNESNLQTVVVTDKSGQQLTLTKIDFSAYYDDEESYSDYEYTPDEESSDYGYYGYYGDEETADDVPAVFQFTRADQGELLLFLKADMVSFSLTIPATKTCPELEIAGDLIEQEGSKNVYFYTDPSGYKLKAEMITKNENPGWKFSCASGKCPDANDKCGIWKEEFMIGY